MGAIGLASLAGGRTGGGLSFLCLATICLLLADPALSTSFGFLLSVLATLGIVVAGRRIMAWLPHFLPRWAAAGLAVPLAAQVFCGPAIVLLQPQFTTYALAANFAASALVPPVTLLGTAAVPLVPFFPGLATAPLAIAAASTTGVAGIARFFAGLPGAALPWPEGPYGMATMALFSVVVVTFTWLVLHPATVAAFAGAAQTRIVVLLDGLGAGKTRGWSTCYGLHWATGQGRRGLVDRRGRGTLRVCKRIFWRNHEWLLPRPHEPGPPRRTPPPGAT
jgi:competence protein ComEC